MKATRLLPHRRLSLLTLLLTFLLLACSGPAKRPADTVGIPAEAREAGFHIERGERRFEFEQALREVVIINRYGDLRVRRGKADAVGLSYAVQRFAPEWAAPTFEVEETGDSIRLTVSFDAEAPEARSRFGRVGRVDLVAYVPESAVLEVETLDGALLVRHRPGPIRARSQSGRLQASSDTGLTLVNDTGATLARLTGHGVLQGADLQSGKGPLDILLPRLQDYALQVEARAGISLGLGWYPGEAFPLEPNATRLSYRLDAGLPLIRLRSEGTVSLGVVAELPAAGEEDRDEM